MRTAKRWTATRPTTKPKRLNWELREKTVADREAAIEAVTTKLAEDRTAVEKLAHRQRGAAPRMVEFGGAAFMSERQAGILATWKGSFPSGRRWRAGQRLFCQRTGRCGRLALTSRLRVNGSPGSVGASPRMAARKQSR